MCIENQSQLCILLSENNQTRVRAGLVATRRHLLHVFPSFRVGGSAVRFATIAVGNGVDGAAFDPSTGLAMTANGRDGTLSVVKETSPGKFEVVATPKTLAGARTITMNMKTHQALLPCNVPDGKGGQTFGNVVVGAVEAKK